MTAFSLFPRWLTKIHSGMISLQVSFHYDVIKSKDFSDFSSIFQFWVARGHFDRIYLRAPGPNGLEIARFVRFTMSKYPRYKVFCQTPSELGDMIWLVFGGGNSGVPPPHLAMNVVQSFKKAPLLGTDRQKGGFLISHKEARRRRKKLGVFLVAYKKAPPPPY